MYLHFQYLNKQNGIKSATVNLVMANALIEYDENILNLETLEKFSDINLKKII